MFFAQIKWTVSSSTNDHTFNKTDLTKIICILFKKLDWIREDKVLHSEERVKNEKSKLEDPVNLEEDSTEITDCVLTEGKNQLEVKSFSLVVNNDHLNSDVGNDQNTCMTA